ncbi:MAG: nuclear transport factor 2 family protein [Pseudomonadota bacterium]
MDLLDRFRAFYASLGRGDLSGLNTVYSQDVSFIDPVGTHQGLRQLEAYFQALLDGCAACQFKIRGLRETGETAFVEWTMSFAHKRLKAGQDIHVDGFSILSIANGKVDMQRDYYDMGAMIYEHVPVVGRIVRALRGRLGR